MLMKTFRIFISSEAKTSGTKSNCVIPLNQSLFPKFDNPELRIETLHVDNALFAGSPVINVAMPNLISPNMQVVTTTPAQSSIIHSFPTFTYNEETTRESMGVSISSANLMNSGFIQIQLLGQNGEPLALADDTKTWFMTLCIIDREK
jgi:hypothetical protein